MAEDAGAGAGAGGAAADLAIEEVGDRIYRLPLPIPFEVGPVNCYLIRRDAPALIDTGPKMDAAHEALLAHFAALRFHPAELRHILLSHSHVDHHGDARRVAELAPAATIHAHEADARPIFEHDENMLAKVEEIMRLVRYWGYPEATFPSVRRAYLSFRKFADSFARDRFVPIRGDTADLALGATRLRAIHCPGHTEGLVCFHLAEAGGLLFASDHVLERITPNPTVYLPSYRGRRTGLADYVESLRRVRDLPVARVLPGHGASFAGLGGRVDVILEHHERRKEKIANLVAAGGERTVLELILELWPGLKPDDYYLACREVHGHLDLLLADGVVEELVKPEGVAVFRRRA